MPYYPPGEEKTTQPQTIFQRSTPSARLIFNSMFVVVVLYCVKLFLKICFVQNPSLLSFSFPFVVFSILLSYLFILLEFSKCLMSQNIGCLVKTQLISLKKNSTQTFFLMGVAHEQHWSSIVCLLSWSSIVSSFFLKWTFSSILFSFICPFLC